MTECVKEFYSHDIVYRFDKRGIITFGVVMDTYESSDSDDSQGLLKGQMEVHWLRGTVGREQVIKQNRVKLLSRNVLDGDIVRRLENGKETQRGYCRSIKRRSVVKIVGCNSVVENVAHTRLMYLHPLQVGAPVCVGLRIGRVYNCEYVVRLTSRDGSVIEIVPEDPMAPSSRTRIFASDSGMYLEDFSVGNIKSIVPAHLKYARWIKKTKTIKLAAHKRHLFMVQKITPIVVTIHVHPIRGQNSFLYDVPEEDFSHIKVLQTLDETVPAFNDPRCVTITSEDTVLVKSNWFAKQSAKYRPDNVIQKKCKKEKFRINLFVYGTQGVRAWRHIRFLRNSTKDEEDTDWTTDEEDEESPPKRKPKKMTLGHPVEVQAMCTEAYATIIWQDGTMEPDVPTTQLYYSISLDDHEFFPGEWVIRAFETRDMYGVVQNVECLERTAQVKWFIYSPCEDTPIFSHQEEHSVYDIKRHPTFVFRPSSIVYRMKACTGNLGTVIDSFPDGFVKVKWMDGTEEDCWPTHIGMLPENMSHDTDSEDSLELDNSLQMSWETESFDISPGCTLTEPTWHVLVSRLELMRGRITYLRDAMLTREYSADENISVLKNLLTVYENSTYLDKLLDTHFFSIRSRHYQALLYKIKEKAKEAGIAIHSKCHINNLDELKAAEMDNLNKVLKLECHLQKDCVNESNELNEEPSTPTTTDEGTNVQSNTSLCIELLSMLKCRMDLSLAEMISRMGGSQVFSVFTKSSEIATPATSTPIRSAPPTSDDSFTSISFTTPKPADCNVEAMFETSQSLESSALEIILAPTKPCVVKGAENMSNLFEVLEEAPHSHRFYRTEIQPVANQCFYRAVMNEAMLLRESLPPGVWVYAFANRTDLYSVMIRGPNNTPYEDGLFIFDLQLSPEYPRSPPQCCYISYNTERLNPNLYPNGRVCVSLLGTWMGRGTEVWGPKSTLLQLIVSIQGLILVAEPYYNEAGYEKQCNSQQGYENSRTYNELVLLRLVLSMTDMLESPHEIFRSEIYKHFREHGHKMIQRLGAWIDGVHEKEPEFPLLPVSKGLKLSLRACLDRFKEVLRNHAAS